VREDQPAQLGEHLVLLGALRRRDALDQLVEALVVAALADDDAAGPAERLDALARDRGGERKP
jgi:hypothetical protein